MTSNKTSEDIAMDNSGDTNATVVASDTSRTSDVNNTNELTRNADQLNLVDIKEIAADVNNGNIDNSEYKPMPIKKKHRRGSRRNKRRRYKPYSELTWEEKKAIEERDSRRAVNIRKKYMHEKGRPLAPFNTSQFLMAEHDTEEPDLHVSHHHHHEPHTRLSSSADDSDYGESSLSDEEQDIEEVRNFLQKDFAETYDRVHSELLHKMNKDELVNEYMQLEDKVENLEKELAVMKSNGVQLTNGLLPDVAPVLGQVTEVNKLEADDKTTRRDLEQEVEKLREENKQLHLENSVLKPTAETLNYNA